MGCITNKLRDKIASGGLNSAEVEAVKALLDAYDKKISIKDKEDKGYAAGGDIYTQSDFDVTVEELDAIDKANNEFLNDNPGIVVKEGDKFYYEKGVITLDKNANRADRVVYLGHEIVHAKTEEWLKDVKNSAMVKRLEKAITGVIDKLEALDVNKMTDGQLMLWNRLAHDNGRGIEARTIENVAVLAAEPAVRKELMKFLPEQDRSIIGKILDKVKEWLGKELPMDAKRILELVDSMVDKAEKESKGEVRQLVEEPDGELPRSYYNTLNTIVRKALGTKVKTSEYLAFTKATLDNISVVGGTYDKGKVKLSKKPQPKVMDAEAERILQEWYTTESPYAVDYQMVDEVEFAEKLQEDEMYKKVVSEHKHKVAAEMLAEFAKKNGAHTLAHEMVHAGSIEFIRSNPEHEYTKRLEELYKEALDKKEDIRELATGSKYALMYWETSMEEFIAEGLSNPGLVKALQYTKTKNRGMLTNMFRELVSTLGKMIGIKQGDNVYKYLLDGYVAMVESQVASKGQAEIIDGIRATISKARAKQESDIIGIKDRKSQLDNDLKIMEEGCR